MSSCSRLTFLFPAVPEMPLCGSGPPEVAAALSVYSSSPRTGTAAAWPRRSPPAQTPPTRLCSSCCWCCPRCCCCWTCPQVPRSTRSWWSRGRPAQRRGRTEHTGNPNSRCFRCCRYYYSLRHSRRRGHSLPTASCRSVNFWHTNSTDVKTCKEIQTQIKRLHNWMALLSPGSPPALLQTTVQTRDQRFGLHRSPNPFLQEGKVSENRCVAW